MMRRGVNHDRLLLGKKENQWSVNLAMSFYAVLSTSSVLLTTGLLLRQSNANVYGAYQQTLMLVKFGRSFTWGPENLLSCGSGMALLPELQARVTVLQVSRREKKKEKKKKKDSKDHQELTGSDTAAFVAHSAILNWLCICSRYRQSVSQTFRYLNYYWPAVSIHWLRTRTLLRCLNQGVSETTSHVLPAELSIGTESM